MTHPSLGDLSQFHKILDTGAGTAIWTEDFLAGGAAGAVTKPADDVVVDCADLNIQYFPSKKHPKMGDLFAHDALQPFPADQQGKYDLVSQRLLAPALTLEQWPVALKNVFDALRT
jgi:hypothetical protein